MKRIAGLALLLLAFAAQAGQVYKWTDDKGRVHFSDKSVPSAKKIEVNPPGAATPPSADAVQAQRAKECENKREQLNNYQRAERVVERDSLGNDREYTAEERQKLIARVRQQMEEACSAQAPPASAEVPPAEVIEPGARAEPLQTEEPSPPPRLPTR